MTNGEPALRLPKEATCDVECAMKVESLRILSKKRKQSQRADNGASSSTGGTLKGVKRALSDSGLESDGGKPGSSYSAECDTSSGSTTSFAKSSSGGASPGGSAGNNRDPQRRRFVWSEPLHQDFVAAVFDIGLKCASPKLLLEMMPVVDGLTSEHIKSHLQKYRLHRHRSRQEFLKSYGYLTDLDGGKGLGGGSAAATIKAAAAAAGDLEKSLGSRSSPKVSEELSCSTKSCGCNGNSQNVSSGDTGDVDPIANGTSLESRHTKQLPASKPKMVPVTPGDSAKSGSVDREEENAEAQDRGKEAVESGVDSASAADEAVRHQLPQTTATMPVVASGLLQSHLELLAKGIELQLKFHRHLREVVNSQRALQMQLLGPHGRDYGSNHGNTERNSPHGRDYGSNHGNTERNSASPTGISAVTAPTATSTSTSTLRLTSTEDVSVNLEADTVSIRAGDDYHASQKMWSIDGEVSVAGSMVEPSAMNSVPPVDNEVDSSGGDKTKSQSGQPPQQKQHQQQEQQHKPRQKNVRGNAESIDTSKERIGAASGNDGGGISSGSLSPRSSQPARFPVASAPSNTSPEDMNREHHRMPNEMCAAQYNMGAVRGATALHPSAGTLSNPPSSTNQSTANGVDRRAYLPGDFTLATKGSDNIPGAPPPPPPPPPPPQPPHASSTPLARGHGVVAVHNPTDALVVAPPATLVQAAVTSQTPRILQKHMHTQMEIQRSMLESCVERASVVGASQPWTGPGIVPVRATSLVSADARGQGAGAGACASASANVSARRGGTDSTDVHEAEDRVHAVPVSRDQGSDGQSVQPPDAGDTMFLGLLPPDDSFGLDWLDRSELQQGESAVATQRPSGEGQQSLLSFLME